MKGHAHRKKPTIVGKVWLSQAEHAVKFIEKLKATPSIHGVKWTHNMVEHYAQQFYTFRKLTPRSCKKQAKALDERVNIVMVWKDGLH